MSEAPIKSPNTRNARRVASEDGANQDSHEIHPKERHAPMATSREARYKAKLQQQNRQIRELNEALAEAIGILESTPDVEAVQQENEQLRQAMTEGAYRVAWEAAAEKAGVDPEYFEDLWQLAPPEMSEDADPDPAAMLKHVKKSIEGRKVLLASRENDDDDDDDDQGDEAESDNDDDQGDPFGYFGDVSDKADETPPAKPARKPAAIAAKSSGSGNANGKAPTLREGEGARRGARDTSTNNDPFARIEADFAATGRTDAFKL